MHYYEYSLLISGCVMNDEQQYWYEEWRESDFGDMNEYAGQ